MVRTLSFIRSSRITAPVGPSLMAQTSEGMGIQAFPAMSRMVKQTMADMIRIFTSYSWWNPRHAGMYKASRQETPITPLRNVKPFIKLLLPVETMPVTPEVPSPFPLLGLSGGIAAGKSFVASLLAARGWVVIDADALAREAV